MLVSDISNAYNERSRVKMLSTLYTAYFALTSNDSPRDTDAQVLEVIDNIAAKGGANVSHCMTDMLLHEIVLQ